MKKFLIKTCLFFGGSIVLIIGIYFYTDTFKTIYPFELKNISTVNREYLSVELFKKNYAKHRYNSFILCSSRGCGINTYQWKQYLDKEDNQFLFQAWSETIMGTCRKLNYLDSHGVSLKNVIILIDIPSSFVKEQESYKAITIQHYDITGKSKLFYHYNMFLAYLKPSEIFKSIKDKILCNRESVKFDTISNDWNNGNRDNYLTPPKQDSLVNRDNFSDNIVETLSPPLIDSEKKAFLLDIQRILQKHHSKYKIVITPSYEQTKIHHYDLQELYTIFGQQNVFDFSGKNTISTDKYNFSDINHFDLVAGWEIIETIYGKKNVSNNNATIENLNN